MRMLMLQNRIEFIVEILLSLSLSLSLSLLFSRREIHLN